jgi:UDP:flavonoid glycosyltransferase YjiC (YdhE family)
MTRYVPHLLVYISGHGFGHVAQTAPVLNRLRQLLPELRLTICSTAPAAHLQSRILGEFTHLSRAVDFGMVMASALDVLAQESLHAYREFHRDWDARVVCEAEHIAALKPDAVLSNVAYLPLAAARQAGVPCAAMCSLNWADIFAHYCGGMSGAAEILQQMRDAYASADAFLRVTPGMVMADLPNLRPIDPIARLGTNHRAGIGRRLGLKNNEKLVLISMGGIATRLPMESWPEIENVRWLVQADWEVSRADVSTLESLSMDFTDVLASCDALLCKPGYGSFAEAACNGVPVLYVSRHDWPEEACLVEWLAQHGRCVEVGRKQLEEGDLHDALAELFGQPRTDAVEPRGIDQAADYLRSSIENC